MANAVIALLLRWSSGVRPRLSGPRQRGEDSSKNILEFVPTLWRQTGIKESCSKPKVPANQAIFSKAGSMTSQLNGYSATFMRLDNWKAIACHFGRSCRTVQRWYASYGLPVRRLGDHKGPVFAYVAEVDDWMRNRGRFLETKFNRSSGLTLGQPPIVRPESDRQGYQFETSLIPEASRERSAEMVILGYRMWETLSHRNLSTITKLFREAIDLNPRNAAAFAGLSQSLVAEVLCGLLSPEYAFASAQAALREGLEIDPAMPEVVCADAWIKLVLERDWRGACCGFDTVLNRHPQFMSALMGRAALLIANGRLKEASALLLRISRWNALNSLAPALHCWCEYLAGDYPSAMLHIQQARASGLTGSILDTVEMFASIQLAEPRVRIEHIEPHIAESPHADVLRGALGYAYAIAGKPDCTNQILDAMTNYVGPRKTCDPYAIALVLIALDRRQEAVERLAQSYREGSLWSLGFQSDPFLTPLKANDSLFRQLLSNFPHQVDEPIPELGVASPIFNAGSHHSRI